MPEMTALGWFHTALGIAALSAGIISFLRFGQISWSNKSGKIYLIGTLITAISALGIYNQGGFGIAHILALLTLGAVAVGTVAERTVTFGRLGRYFQAVSFSATFLFHMIPAITDGLMRLPVGDPVVTNIGDPLLRGFYVGFLGAYLLGVGIQIRRLRNQ